MVTLVVWGSVIKSSETRSGNGDQKQIRHETS